MKSFLRTMSPTHRPDLLVRVIDGEVVILDQARGQVHQLNATASCIWNSCDGSRSVDAIAAQIAAMFDVTLDAAHRDVTAAITEFRGLGLLVPE